MSHWGFPPARLATVSACVYGTLPFATAVTGSIPGTKAAWRTEQRSSLKPLFALVAELRYTFIHPWVRKKSATVRKNNVGDLKCYGLNNSKGSLKAMGSFGETAMFLFLQTVLLVTLVTSVCLCTSYVLLRAGQRCQPHTSAAQKHCVGLLGLSTFGAHSASRALPGMARAWSVSEHRASAFLKLGFKDTSACPSSKLLADLKNFTPRAMEAVSLLLFFSDWKWEWVVDQVIQW